MVFSSIPFLYYFLPCVLILYFAVPKKLKNAVLLLASLFFYAWGEPRFVSVMILSILQGYLFGIGIEKKRGSLAKIYLVLSVVISLAVLIYCKYANFFIDGLNRVTGLSIPLLHIALPVGISFYTFQILSYVVDVYRRIVPAQRNLIHFATYVAMFPQLVAGPIVRYSDIAGQLEERVHSEEKCALGIRRFLMGLGKKVLMADVLGALCTSFRASAQQSVLFCWLYALGYTLHIYFDFSGYSDMAIGLGKIFGFDFPENFRYPYIAGSVTEFWRRWHISLGSWFRDYVYIPLGGNHVAKWRWLCNLMTVWLLTGFWHGAAWKFILWGVYFGILLLIEKLWLNPVLCKIKCFCHIYVMAAVTLSFVLFDAASVREAFSVIKGMFGMGGVPLVTVESLYYLKSYAIVLLFAAIGATPLLSEGMRRIQKTKNGSFLIAAIEPVCLFLILCAATGYILDGSFHPFLYFRF